MALFRNRAVECIGAKSGFAHITRGVPHQRCEERLPQAVVDNPACACTGAFRQIDLIVHLLIHFSGTCNLVLIHTLRCSFGNAPQNSPFPPALRRHDIGQGIMHAASLKTANCRQSWPLAIVCCWHPLQFDRPPGISDRSAGSKCKYW